MENPKPAETPMGRVWVIVIGTMVAVTIMCFLWHIINMSQVREDNLVDEKNVKVSIEKISQYLSQVSSKASTTPILDK